MTMPFFKLSLETGKFCLSVMTARKWLEYQISRDIYGYNMTIYSITILRLQFAAEVVNAL